MLLRIAAALFVLLVAATPVRKLILFNAHGGQPQILDLAAPRLRRETGLLVVRATYFRFGTPPGLIPEAEARYGLHGGMLETSLMLAIAPELVRADAVYLPLPTTDADRPLSRATKPAYVRNSEPATKHTAGRP